MESNPNCSGRKASGVSTIASAASSATLTLSKESTSPSKKASKVCTTKPEKR